MNSFGQIVDLTSVNGIESGKTGPGSPNNGEAKSLGIDFSQILGGKLSGELPLLFGENTDAVEAEKAVSEEILSEKMTESLLFDSLDEQKAFDADSLVNQNNLIDTKGINSKLLLNTKIAGEANNSEKSANFDTVFPAEQNIKAENLNIISKQSILSPEVKIDDLNLNSLNTLSNQINIDKPKVDLHPVVTAEVDAELKAQNVADPKTTSILDKVAGSLNIKNVKLEKNSETNQTDKDPVKLVLPTKSYIKVSTVDTNSNNNQFANTKQNMFPGTTEVVNPEIELSDNDKIKSSNVEAAARVELNQVSSGKIETGQPTIQTKLISDVVPTLTNNVEKVEMPETKIPVEPVRFVIPEEINGKNIKNNHTVMIRMEPDHLGPVRMTVSTHNNIMTARLVVESPIAKATVESNLNNLVEQLDKQGIKVDSLNVSVNGGNVGQHTKENRFAESTRMARQNLKSYEKSGVIDEVMTQSAREHLYIDTSGVNCFA